MTMRKKLLLLAALLLAAGPFAELRAADPAPVPETAQARDARMQWFREAKFGMFIHWGLYSQLADEWRTPLALKQTKRGAEITLPAVAPDPIDSVVVVEIEGAPEVFPGARKLSGGKPVEVSSVWPGREAHLNQAHVTDGKRDTIWATEEKARAGWVTVNLERECEVFEAMVSDALYGRTQAFDLEAKVNGEWKQLASGGKIGNELRLNFAPVKARYFRLYIRKATDTPVVAEFQLFGN